MDIPLISVLVTQAGAAPAEMETQITRKVEDAVASVAGVKHITSSITDGASTTLVELRLEVSTDRALNDVKDAVAKIREDLPRTIEEPIIERIDVVGQAIQTFAASAPGMTPEQLSWFIDDTVMRDLQGVAGVGRVDRIGGVKREIEVDLQPDRMAALGVTAGQINAQLRATNVELAGGRGEVGGKEQAIRTLANAPSLEALADTRIVHAGRPRDSASPTWPPSPTGSRNRGKLRPAGRHHPRGRLRRVPRQGGQRRLRRRTRPHPAGRSWPRRTRASRLTLIDDSVRGTYGGYLSAMHSLIEGAALATIVVFIFLRDWRATLLAAVALPLSVLPAFFFMNLMGFSLNFVSLLAITLVTGILVDDAIVEIENIVRHMRMGKSAWHASIEAADEIGLAVVAITLTIVGRVRPRQLHGRHPRPVFQAVRPDRRIRRAGQPAGGAPGDARHGRLLPASRTAPGASSAPMAR